MTERKCATCDHPVRSTVVICRRCRSSIRALLTRQPALLEDLVVEFERRGRKQTLKAIRGHEQPLPYGHLASELIARQSLILGQWMATAARHRTPLEGPVHSDMCRNQCCYQITSSRPPADDNVAAMCAYLEGCLRDLQKLDEGAELLRSLRRLTSAIVRVVDLPADRVRRPVGPCPKLWPIDDREEHCPGQVWAIVPADDGPDADPPMLRCSACHAEWPSWQWNRTGSAIMARGAQLEQQQALAATYAKTA